MPITEKARTIAAGDDIVFNFTVTDAPEGATLDGATIKWWMAPQRTGNKLGPPIVEKSTGAGITIIDAAARKFSVQLDKEDTEGRAGRFYHEAEVTDSDGKKSTVTIGILTILPTLIPSVDETEEEEPAAAVPSEIEEINAEIALLEQARKDWLSGKRRSEVRYESSSVRFGGDFGSTYEALLARLRELRVQRARLTGEPSGVGPTRFGFGRWP